MLMTVKSLLAGLLAGVMCVSCGENQPAGGQGQSRGKTLAGAADMSKSGAQKRGELRIPEAPIVRPQADVGGSAAAAPSSGAPLGADLSDMPLAPKDAQWTIYCATVADPSHVETSRSLKAALVKRTSMREWYILHESNQSRLYYGFYRSFNDKADAAESSRAQADRKKIDELVDGAGERPFRACQFVPLSAPDPESRPEWNLVNAPADKFWTLEIGSYKDHPDRKKFAVDAVREARAAGEEAYYYHGDTVSSVCVGAWPETAVAEERVDSDPKARKNSHGDILVLPPGIKDPGKIRDKQGRPIGAVGQRLVPVEPSLTAKIEQYPVMLVNGEELIYKTKNSTQKQSSLLKPIPRPGETLFRDNAAATGGRVATDQTQADGRGLDPQDPFSRPGYEDTAVSRWRSQHQNSNPANRPGQLRSLGKQ
jgi:hypothetical protein